MDFAFSDEQALLQASARSFFERECTEAHVRAMEGDADGFSRALWSSMAQLGWLGTAIPEHHGGAGLGPIELAILAEEAGRVLLPEPLIENSLCAALLAAAGTEEQQARHLPAIAEGREIHTWAILESSADWRPAAIQMRPTGTPGRGSISGSKLFVPFAGTADVIHFWTVSRSGELAVVLIPPSRQGLRIERMETSAKDHQFEVVLDGVEFAEGDVLRLDSAAVRRWWNLATVLECGYLLGLAERSLEMTVAYARDRRQFGQPIGAFQAVQHRAANMRIDVDAMRVAVYRAAWLFGQGSHEQDAAVAVAKAFCSDASRRVVGNMQQVHGGVGFTRDYPAQLYFRRQKRGELRWGDAAFHRERLSELRT